jgi:hypothetical protein
VLSTNGQSVKWLDPSAFASPDEFVLWSGANAAMQAKTVSVGVVGLLDLHASLITRPYALAQAVKGMQHVQFSGPSLSLASSAKGGLASPAVLSFPLPKNADPSLACILELRPNGFWTAVSTSIGKGVAGAVIQASVLDNATYALGQLAQ